MKSIRQIAYLIFQVLLQFLPDLSVQTTVPRLTVAAIQLGKNSTQFL
ncbi:hypothetical protein QNH26_20290 [Peribacillus frigoritolerans]|nr:hypothetical protein [Peribacillus frigoritolerans]WHX65986.1 hypothetical protein QNH26_20290 [Peribacillus frigoritolerans]